jgi:hypothetical protein
LKRHHKVHTPEQPGTGEKMVAALIYYSDRPLAGTRVTIIVLLYMIIARNQVRAIVKLHPAKSMRTVH